MGKVILTIIALGHIALAQNFISQKSDTLFPVESKYIYKSIDDVKIITSDNNLTSLSNLWNKKPFLLTLIFSRCAGICSPLISSLKFSIEKITGNEREKNFYIVVLSFDTADTPEDMDAFKKDLNLSERNDWIFGIFADKEKIKKFTDELGFWFNWIDSIGQYDHPGIVVGIRDGKIVRILVGGEITVVKLREVIDEIEGNFVPFYEIQKNVAFRCLNYDPETGKIKIGIGTLIMFIPAFFTFFITFTIFIFSGKIHKQNQKSKNKTGDTKMRAKFFKAFTLLFAVISLTNYVYSIPLFARKYNRSCFTCHTTPPMLNEFGRRFQSNGYQLPGTVESTPIWMSNQLPFAAMLHSMFTWTKEEMGTEKKSTFTFARTGADIFTAGTLGKHLSYFAAVVVDPAEGGGYEAAVEVAHVIYNNILPMSNLNLKFGSFRLDLPYPVNLALSEAGYLVYEYASEVKANGQVEAEFSLAEPQLGVSAYGFLPQVLDGLRYEIALVNGTNVNEDIDNTPDLYFRVNQSIWINNAPFRAGILYYLGTMKGSQQENKFNRFGFDAEVYDPWTKKVNVFFQYLTATDKIGDEERKMNGGFIGANVFILPEKVAGFTRYDFMKVGDEKTNQITIGLRYHFAPNVFLTGEYSWMKQDTKSEMGMPMTMKMQMFMLMTHFLF